MSMGLTQNIASSVILMDNGMGVSFSVLIGSGMGIGLDMTQKTSAMGVGMGSDMSKGITLRIANVCPWLGQELGCRHVQGLGCRSEN